MVLSACCRNARTTSVPEPQLCFPAPDSFSFIVLLCRESCLFFEKSSQLHHSEVIKCTQTSEKAYVPPQVLPLQRVSGLLRPMPCKRGGEWAFEGKPNRAPHAVGATESVSVNKAGMCWHITSGQGHSCQDWVAPQEHLIRSCPFDGIPHFPGNE